MDFLAVVAAYPKPDEKIRSTSLKVQGGGNVGNALTCAARLGLTPRIISKVANDTQGKAVLEELEADGVDTSFFIVSKEGNTSFTYVIVDQLTKTRTCIFNQGYPPMVPEDLPRSTIISALDGARLAYFDARMHETALVIAQEAVRMNIPILVDAERPREGLNDILHLADYVVCSAKFPQAWTEATTVPRGLLSLLIRYPNINFVIVTLGEDGCIMLERSVTECTLEMDIDLSVELLEKKKDENISTPTCLSTSVMRFKGEDVGTVFGRLYIGTAVKIPPSELIDTTGAGDAFVGAVVYALCANISPHKMLPFAAYVAAAKCRALGARTGLPRRTDPHLASILREGPKMNDVFGKKHIRNTASNFKF